MRWLPPLFFFCLLAAVLGSPGSYTGIGGVYNDLRLENGVMEHAKRACECLPLWIKETVSRDF